MSFPICKPFDELEAGELYRILQARANVFVIEQTCIYPDCDDKDYDAQHMSLWDSGQLAAYCRILPTGVSYPNYCSIGRVLSTTAFRGQGYGRAVMEYAIEYCTQQYTQDIKISAQCYLEKFYQSLGFESVGESYLEDNIPHIAMIRPKNQD